MDIRGHGCSGGQRGGYKVSEVVTDIRQLLDQLELRFEGRLAFGCSIGAKLGLAVAEQEGAYSGTALPYPRFSQSYPRISGI